MNRNRFPAVALCLLLAAAAGCGAADRATVTGKVVYRGAPVTGGMLNLTDAKGTFTIPIRADGTFVETEVPVGLMAVTVNTDNVGAKPSVALPQPPKDSPALRQAAGSGAAEAKKVDLPARYRDPKTSGLKWDVKPGVNAAKTWELTD